jgi:hypothetical protein
MNLTELIIVVITVLLSVSSVAFSIWTLIDTRKRYYYEPKQKK